jgi:hypothetical protein
MYSRAPSTATVLRIIGAVTMTLAAVIFLLIFAYLCSIAFGGNLGPNPYGAVLALALLGLFAFLSGVVAWRLWRGTVSANGITLLPTWFIQVFGVLWLGGAAFVAYHKHTYWTLIEGVPFALAMIFFGRHVVRRKSTPPAEPLPPDHPAGIVLGEDTFWVVTGITDYATFFRNVAFVLPEAPTYLYLEGTRTAPEVAAFMDTHAIAPQQPVRAGTVWPQPRLWHLPVSQELVDSLAAFAARHATAQIAHHCHIYTSAGMILQWYDACDQECPIGLAASISEAQAQRFADATGATLSVYEPPKA